MKLRDLLARCDPDSYIEIRGVKFFGRVRKLHKQLDQDAIFDRHVAVISAHGDCLYITLGR